MNLLYINLKSQPDRRAAVERDFACHNPTGWALHRIEAIDTAFVAREGIRGEARPAEIACLLSHRAALEMAMTLDGHVMIAEDDVLLAEKSTAIIASAAQALNEDSWDILFTDLAITDLRLTLDLFFMKRQLGSAMHLIDLRELAFSGSTAYVVNRTAKKKFLEILSRPEALNWPVDLWIRKNIYDGKLRGRVTFPFATSISKFADSSQIQESGTGATETVWNAFRRMMFHDEDLKAVQQSLAQIDERFYDEEATTLSMILRPYLSRNFLVK